jgi:hypothetical protein
VSRVGSKEDGEQAPQAMFLRAVTIAEEAKPVYLAKKVEDVNLLGQVYFNMGAARADNPNGDLEKAANCYSNAFECFKSVDATDDLIRTSI